MDQIVNLRQALLPEAEDWGQYWLSRVDNLICHPQHRAWLFLSHQKSVVHSPSLSLYFRPICKTHEHEHVHGFSNNSLPCKQMTTFSPLPLVSTQLVKRSSSSEWVCSKIQINFNQNYRTELQSFIRIIVDGICFSLNSFLQSNALRGIPIYHPSWVATGDWSNYFPPNSIVIYRRNLLGVINDILTGPLKEHRNKQRTDKMRTKLIETTPSIHTKKRLKASCIVCSCAVLSHCFTYGTCARDSTFFV